jgi:hypothetical protein
MVDALIPARGWDFQLGRTFALAGVALFGGLFPLFAMVYRRRLRPKFLAERPTRRRLHLRCPKPEPIRKKRKPADDLAVAAFYLSLMFFMPLAPLVGGLLGFAVIATRKCRSRRLVKLGFAAAPLGLTITVGQLAMVTLVLMNLPSLFSM